MMKLFTRQTVTIILAIALVVLVIYSRTGREMNVGDKYEIINYINKEDKPSPFKVYSMMEDIQIDEKKKEEIVHMLSEGKKAQAIEIINKM
jgi:hypothetical protein